MLVLCINEYFYREALRQAFVNLFFIHMTFFVRRKKCVIYNSNCVFIKKESKFKSSLH